LLALPAFAFAAKVRMLPGSFLKQPVYSAQELSLAIKQDKVLALRYSKHFGMPPAELAEYIANNTGVKNLTHSHRYIVYYVGKDGKIAMRTRLIKAGTRVLVDWKGEPIMDLRCGNPFTKVLPQRPVVVQPPPVAPPPPIAQVEPVAPPLVPVETKVLDVPPAELPPPMPPQVVTQTKVTSFILPALVGAGAVGALAGGGDTVVPEPASVLVLGLGAFGVLYGRRAMRRK